MFFKKATNNISDICLIIEGSYPYVKGGVASWVHQITTNYPNINFELVVIVASDKEIYNLKYELPSNIKKIHHVYIKRSIRTPVFSIRKMKKIELIKKFFANYFNFDSFEEVVKYLLSLSTKQKERLLKEALYSQEVFDYMNELYENSKFREKSYIDFFWSIKAIYNTFLNILLSYIPKAKVYHTISTGYAGLFASICKIKYPMSRLLLTEHGIYTRERKMDITISDWVDRDHQAYNPKESISLYKNIWAEAFKRVSLITYHYSNEIISLNEKNNLIQISEGASKEKVYFVRNGVNLENFSFKERKMINSDNPIIGFLGRIVKIKDVKTFIKSANYVLQKYPNAKFLIAGPTQEDEEYYKICEKLIFSLKLENNINFLGSVNPKEFLDQIDIMVLTSLSEGQPLVIAEANASGVPCVATDVGGCKEMIEGAGEDKEGISGIITASVNPKETADAIFKFIQNPIFYNQCSINGRNRVIKFYNEINFLAKYKKIYQKNIDLSGVK